MRFLAVFFILSVNTSAGAQDSQPQLPGLEELFGQASQTYQAGQFSEAAQKFQTLADKQPHNATIYFNWGLAEYQSGHKGLGVALWRKALSLAPAFESPRQALRFATEALQLRSFNRSSWFSEFREEQLARIPVGQVLGINAVILAICGWLNLTYLARRRKARKIDLPTPAYSWVAGTFAALWLASTFLGGVRVFDHLLPRATVITNVPVRSGPSAASSALYDLKEGADITLRQSNEGWTQIRDPEGMSGWVPNDALFQTSGITPW
jgi:tetratricopeptide (TPR) repeat protein